MIKHLLASAGDATDVGLIPGLGRSPRVGNGNTLQYSYWKVPFTEKPGRTVHGMAKKGYDWGRSQDGGGIGRGDHFLFYKFIERTTER